MNQFELARNISVFNIQPVYNAFVEEIEKSSFKNIIRNTDFSEELDRQIYRWVSSIDLLAPDSIDPITQSPTFTLANQNFIKQNITNDLDLNQSYGVVVRIKNTKDTRIEVKGGSYDISNPTGNQISTAEILIPPSDGTNWNVAGFVFETRDNPIDGTTAFNADVFFSIISEASDNEIEFGGFTVVKGGINFEGIHPEAQILDNIRYNKFDDSTSYTQQSYWEITHNGIGWNRLWSDDYDFELRVLDIFSSLTLDNYLTVGDFYAGDGIAIDTFYTVGNDSTRLSILISTTGIGGGGDGTSVIISGQGGNWTDEDVRYQTLLEDSAYRYLVYDRFIDDNMAKTGSITHYSTFPGKYTVGAGSVLISPPILPAQDSTGPFVSFFISHDSDVPMIVEYTIDGGINWVLTPEGDYLESLPFGYDQLQFRFTATQYTNFYSYGVLFGKTEGYVNDSTSIGNDGTTVIIIGGGQSSVVAFREQYVVPVGGLPVDTIINIPNGQLYHPDGVSLQIRYNRATLIIGTDYTEELPISGLGLSEAIKFKFPLEEGDIIEFFEYFGYVDQSIDNGAYLTLLDQRVIENELNITEINITDATQDTRIINVEMWQDNFISYSHPTGNGNNHLPADGTIGDILINNGLGAGVWGSSGNNVFGNPVQELIISATALSTIDPAFDIFYHALGRLPYYVKTYVKRVGYFPGIASPAEYFETSCGGFIGSGEDGFMTYNGFSYDNNAVILTGQLYICKEGVSVVKSVFGNDSIDKFIRINGLSQFELVIQLW